jgi:hypothetical protein
VLREGTVFSNKKHFVFKKTKLRLFAGFFYFCGTTTLPDPFAWQQKNADNSA